MQKLTTGWRSILWCSYGASYLSGQNWRRIWNLPESRITDLQIRNLSHQCIRNQSWSHVDRSDGRSMDFSNNRVSNNRSQKCESTWYGSLFHWSIRNCCWTCLGRQCWVIIQKNYFKFNVLFSGAINPARDFGPRMWAAIFDGSYAFEGVEGTNSEYFFWIPLLGPLIGGAAGKLKISNLNQLNFFSWSYLSFPRSSSLAKWRCWI